MKWEREEQSAVCKIGPFRMEVAHGRGGYWWFIACDSGRPTGHMIFAYDTESPQETMDGAQKAAAGELARICKRVLVELRAK